MSLTGPIFLGAVVVFTVAAFVVLIIQWPSLAGRRPTKIAARAGMLLVVNALVLLTAATQLNAQFLFFADALDVVGVDPPPERFVGAVVGLRGVAEELESLG